MPLRNDLFSRHPIKKSLFVITPGRWIDLSSFDKIFADSSLVSENEITFASMGSKSGVTLSPFLIPESHLIFAEFEKDKLAIVPVSGRKLLFGFSA